MHPRKLRARVPTKMARRLPTTAACAFVLFVSLVALPAPAHASVCQDPLCKKLNVYRTVHAYAEASALTEQYIAETLSLRQKEELQHHIEWIRNEMTLEQAAIAMIQLERASYVTPMVLPCSTSESNQETLMHVMFGFGIAAFVFVIVVFVLELLYMLRCRGKGNKSD